MKKYNKEYERQKRILLGLDKDLFDDTKVEPSIIRNDDFDQTEDEIFKQYNEPLSKEVAAHVLGDDYNDAATNFRLCTDLTGMAVTYDLGNEEHVVRLERMPEDDVPQVRSSLLEPEHKDKTISFNIRWLIYIICGVAVIATIGLIILWLI